MIYEYVIDNNEYYPEDNNQVSIFSFEHISNTEFESIVKNAFQLCGDWKSYTRVAKKIVEIDSRFFVPEYVSCAFIGYEAGDYDEKIRGFHHK